MYHIKNLWKSAKIFFKDLLAFWSPIILAAASLIVYHKVYTVLDGILSPSLLFIAFMLIGVLITYPAISGRVYYVYN